MTYTPHTPADVQSMLETLGIETVNDLFDEIPDSLKLKGLNLNEGQSEIALNRLMEQRADKDRLKLNFIGGGAYEHYIPAAVWHITTRGEFMTAYTPYQAEASQGALQTFYEYQTMMAKLMAMDVSNASLYDGASSLAEAVLMAIRCQKRGSGRRVLIPKTLHPHYRDTVRTMVAPQHIELEEIPYNDNGQIDTDSLKQWESETVNAVVIPQPNFFGKLDEVDQLTDWAHKQGAMVIAVVNPLAASWLAPPGEWGEQGADISCGEGQPLGVPLAFGGPYFGFMCCRQSFIRHLPGRLIGRTVDQDGNTGYTLTLQPREQHIRRAKATSNICTNEGLLVTAATIYMSLMGTEGMQRAARLSCLNSQRLFEQLTGIDGIEPVFTGDKSFFNEFAIKLPADVHQVTAALNEQGIEAGHPLKTDYPELGDSLLVCATETKTQEDLDYYTQNLSQIIKESV